MCRCAPLIMGKSEPLGLFTKDWKQSEMYLSLGESVIIITKKLCVDVFWCQISGKNKSVRSHRSCVSLDPVGLPSGSVQNIYYKPAIRHYCVLQYCPWTRTLVVESSLTSRGETVTKRGELSGILWSMSELSPSLIKSPRVPIWRNTLQQYVHHLGLEHKATRNSFFFI